MRTLFHSSIIVIVSAGLFFFPAAVSQVHAAVSPLISFGGRVVSENFCLNGAINIVIIPAGAFPISYVWTPATLSVPPAPAIHIGQNVLGLAAPAPIPCIGFGTHPPIWFGLPVVYGGASVL